MQSVLIRDGSQELKSQWEVKKDSVLSLSLPLTLLTHLLHLCPLRAFDLLCFGKYLAHI